MNTEAPRTAVIVLGENMRIGSGASEIAENPMHMSVPTRINTIAGGIVARDLQRTGDDVDVFTVSGDTAGIGISEAKAMRDYMEQDHVFPELRGKISTEEKSRDTSTNAEEMARILKYDYRKVVLVAPSFHTRRARKLFEAYGIKPDVVRMAEREYIHDEDATLSTKWRRFRLMQKWHRSPQYILEVVKEVGLNIEQFFDKKGRLLRLATNRSRKS